MSASTYILIANAAVWVGLIGYVVFLVTRAVNLKKRARQLELLGGGHDR